MKKIACFLIAALLALEIAVSVPSSAYAATTGTVTASVLNVRSGASTGHTRIGMLYKGATVEILGTEGSWYKISVGSNGQSTGYVHKDYIKVNGSIPSGGSTETTGTGKVNVSALNVRSGASTGSSVIGVIRLGTQVTILESVGDWYKVSVSVNGRMVTAYVSSQYITRTSQGTSSDTTTDSDNNTSTDDTTTTVPKKGKVNTSVLNVRTGASTSHTRIGCIYLNTEVEILDSTNGWYKIKATVNGYTQTGYVSGEYITVTATESTQPDNSGTTNPDSGSTTTPDSGSTGTTQTTTGVVNDGPLNVRSGASTSYSVLGLATKGTVAQILAEEGDWYKVTIMASGRQVTGYVSAKYITKTTTSGTTGGSTDNNTTTTKVGKVNAGPLNVRAGASTSDRVITAISAGTSLKILSTHGDWYKIEVSVGGTTINGYVFANYVTITGESSSTGGTTGGTTGDTTGGTTGGSTGDTTGGSTENTDFEAQLAKFPESYHAALRALHEKYPAWEFEAVNVGLNWDDVVAGEDKAGLNLVQVPSFNSSTNFGQLSTAEGAYKWDTDTYVLGDKGHFYTVSTDVLKYYLDPRNMLDEKSIFQFESQSYEPSQTLDVVQGILKNTFMKGDYTYTANGQTYTKNYAETFFEAGKTYGVSPYFLAARSRTEVAGNSTTGSGQVTGTYGSLSGYYNFYSIGAYGADPIASGLVYAKGGANGTATSYGRPWNNRYKAIMGGAEFIAEEYIKIGQDTSYFQKFNVVYKNWLYGHQYMGAIIAPLNDSVIVYNSYKSLGVLDKTFVFKIPVYNNMPATACAMPAASGNPNSYLKNISVKAGETELLSGFDYKTTSYTIDVPENVTSVTVDASAISKFAKDITGKGTITLNPGENTVKLTCIAGNDTTTEYTIILRCAGGAAATSLDEEAETTAESEATEEPVVESQESVVEEDGNLESTSESEVVTE